jgi:hypothetical protein
MTTIPAGHRFFFFFPIIWGDSLVHNMTKHFAVTFSFLGCIVATGVVTRVATRVVTRVATKG